MHDPERPILVTGATGFLGSRLARRLAQGGARVRVLARRTSDRGRLRGLDVEFAEGDIVDRASIEAALGGAGAVVHVAALYELGTRDPSRMWRINVDGTANVLESAAARGIPSVHVSSTAALGPTGGAIADESHWAGDPPRSAYEQTKRASHELARRMAEQGARVRIAVPSTIYGPDDPSLVGRFHRLYARGAVKVAALREMTMSLVHVDDCAAGIEKIMTAGRDGESYLLCADVVTVDGWLAALARVSGVAPPRVSVPTGWLGAGASLLEAVGPLLGVPRELVREGLAMSAGVSWAFTSAKARRELGWTPRSLEEGLAETLAWYGSERARAAAAP